MRKVENGKGLRRVSKKRCVNSVEEKDRNRRDGERTGGMLKAGRRRDGEVVKCYQ